MTERYTGKGANPLKDGNWLLLNNWSQCSLKCGGGKRFQQWMCIPPRKGGIPCQGKSVRTRPCNRQPCPLTGEFSKTMAVSKKNIVLKPIWKNLPFTSRPQRYIKCQIKESDVLYRTWDSPFAKAGKVKIPARLVMNNHTISLFEDEDYKNNIFTFNIFQTSIGKSKQDCCIIISSQNKQFEICGFNAKCGTKSNPIFFKSWVKSFKLFAHTCYQPHDIGNGLPEVDKLDSKFEKKISQAEYDLINKREKLLEEKLDETDEISSEGNIKKVQIKIIKAIRKELNLEEMIRKEEQEKVDNQTHELMKKFQYEKKKKRCLEKLLKTRDRIDEKNKETADYQNQIIRLKEDAKIEVEKKKEHN